MAISLAESWPSSITPAMRGQRRTGRRRDRGEDFEATGQGGIAIDPVADFGLEVGDAGLSAQLTLELADQRGGLARADLVENGGSIFDRRVAPACQFLKDFQDFWRRGSGVGPEALAEDRQHPRVDRIRFGERAEGVGELARASRIDHGDLEPAVMEKTMRQAVKLAGRLHDYERHLAVRNGLLEPFQTAGVVADSEGSAQRMDEDVEPRFTDVDFEVHLWSDALLRRRLALHAGLAPHHLFRPSVKGRTDPAHPRIQARGATIPPARPPGGGHPQAVIPSLKSIRDERDHARGAGDWPLSLAPPLIPTFSPRAGRRGAGERNE